MTPASYAIVMAVLLVAGVLLVWWLVGGRSVAGPIRVKDVAVMAGAGALGALGQVLVTTELSGNQWHIFSVLYLDLVLAVPLLSAILLIVHTVERRSRAVGSPRPLPHLPPPLLVLTVAMLLLPAAVGWHATHVAPYDLRVDHVVLTDPQPRSNATLRIGVLADLQTESVGGYEERAVRRLMLQEPDVVLIPGDVFQAPDAAFEANRPALVELLGSIDAPGGVFIVDGDVDGNRLPSLAEDAGITHLRDELARVHVRGRDLTIAGMALHPTQRRRTANLQLAAVDDGSFRILLAHRPDWIRLMPEGGADLVVAGHTHGGQVAIPWYGPPLTHSALPRHVAAGGLHEVSGMPIYVSTGVGHEQQGAPQVRFLTRPSVGIIDVEPAGSS